MHPYTVAFVIASLIAVAMGLLGISEAVQQGHRLKSDFFLEVAIVAGVFFFLSFFLVAKFPTWPTKFLLGVRRIFAMKSINTPVKRLSFIFMCLGFLILIAVVGLYYLNDREELLGYWLGGRDFAPPSYRLWLWGATFMAVVGFLASFLHDLVIKPVIQWVYSDPKNGHGG